MLILITGSAGFVGTNLTKRLIDQGHQIIGLDNFATARRANVKLFQDHPDYEFFEYDICDNLQSVLTQSKLLNSQRKTSNIKRTTINTQRTINQIYHLASLAEPKRIIAEPLVTIRTNTVGMTNILDLAKEHQAKILQAPTSEIYGEPQVHPQPESYYGNVNPVDPRCGYNESKRLTESPCYGYRIKHRLDTKIVRIFNTYGPYMNPSDGRVVSTFIIKALTDQPLPIHGDGQQTRSFQYIDDLIDGIIKLMDTPKNFMGPVNIGNPDEFTIMDLAAMILKKLKPNQKSRASDFQILPLGQGDPLRRKPDISLAKQVLNWQPRISLSDGLDQTIAYFKQIL